jgi:hypothetical protein
MALKKTKANITNIYGVNDSTAPSFPVKIAGSDIADTSITATQIANTTITGGKIANSTITNTQMSDVSAAKVSGGTAAVTTGNIGEVITSSAISTTAGIPNSATYVTGSALPLTLGIWQIFYSISMLVLPDVGTNYNISGEVYVTDAAGTFIPNSKSAIQQNERTGNLYNIISLSKSVVVRVTSAQTYKLYANKGINTGNGGFNIYANATNTSDFYAVRIA